MSAARGDGGLPEPVPTVRATDDDRMRTVARLRDAAGEGSIDLDELEQRISAAWEARTLEQLAVVTADLPAPAPPPAAPGRVTRRRPLVLEDDQFRGHLTTYCLVIGMLIGIWLLSGGGHFWPFYPAAGWGVALGSHYQRASHHQRKRLAKARSEGISLAELDRREADERRGRRRERVERIAGAIEGRGARDDASTRYVVAMFVDVVGSTTLNEAVGDAHWAAIRRSLRDLVGDCVESHGGWEANITGDGVLARFEHPAAAADAAVGILRHLDQQRGDTGFAPSVRIGIHSGDAVDDDGDIIGQVVNLAARVTDAAAADEILVTEHVADHLAHRHDTAGRGLHTLKGVSRPRHLLALAWR